MIDADGRDVAQADTTALLYVRIMRAAEAGTGVRFSADEVAYLALDTAICTAAQEYAEDTGRCIDCFLKRCGCAR